jgi:hypothetical protein
MDYFYRIISIWSPSEPPDDLRYFRDSEYDKAVNCTQLIHKNTQYTSTAIEKIYFDPDLPSEIVLKLENK